MRNHEFLTPSTVRPVHPAQQVHQRGGGARDGRGDGELVQQSGVPFYDDDDMFDSSVLDD